MKIDRTHKTHSLAVRILSLTIALVFLTTALPMSVFAQGGLASEIASPCAEAECTDEHHLIGGNVPEDLALQLAASTPTSAPSGPELQQEGEDLYGAPKDYVVGDAERMEDPEEQTSDPNAQRLGELTDERTATAKVYEMSDGYFEAGVSSAPVHFKNDNDTYIDIVTDLVPSIETSQTFGTLSTLSTKTDMIFEAFGESGTATLAGEGWKLSMAYAQADTTVPLRVGNTALYADVADGVDVEYRTTWWGLKENLILTKPTAQNIFDFKLTFEGLELIRDLATSTYQLVDTDTGEVMLEIGNLVVTDSTYDWMAGEYAMCEDAYWEITDSGDGWVTISAIIAEEWIQDPDRTWPVRIDPEVLYSGKLNENPATLGANTFVSTAWPTQHNISFPAELRVGHFADVNGNYGYNRSLAGFTFPTLKGMRMDSAKLTVWQYHRSYPNSVTETYLAPIDRYPTWTDTWNNKPNPTQWVLDRRWTHTNVMPIEFEITAHMQARIDANQTVYGFMFYQSEQGDQNLTHWRKYYSSRSATQSFPILWMKYAPNIKQVTGLTVSTTASEGWFKEVEKGGVLHNTNDRNGQGRGNVTLNWNADPNALGYMVYMFDGKNYNVVGRTVGSAATSWTSAGGGIFPTDSEIKTFTSGSLNPFITASTPSNKSYIANSKTALTHPAGSGSTLTGAGVVAFDGKDMYVKKWSTYPGPDQWVQYKNTGTTSAGVPTYGKGQKIATTKAGTLSVSGFVSDGVLYDGAVTRVSGGTADIEGFVTSTIMEKATPVTLTLSKPPLSRGGGEVAAPTTSVLLAADDNNIYSAGGVAGTTSIRVRVYTKAGTFVKDITYTLDGQDAYGYFNGFTTDGANFYFYEWSGTQRMTKGSIATGKVVNQWHVDTQTANRTVSVAYNKAHNVFVLGQLDTQAAIYFHRGIGVDPADSPKKLYQKIIADPNHVYFNSTNYWFRVIPYSKNELPNVYSGAYVMPTFANRTVKVSDAAQRSFEPIAQIAGEVVEGCLSSSVARLRTVDLAISTPGPSAALTRAYASDMVYTSAYLPKGWMFGFEENITTTSTTAIYTAPDGRRYIFTKSSTGAYIAPNGMVATLVHTTAAPGTFTLTFKDKSVKTFNGTTGKLMWEKDRQGRQTTYDIQTSQVTITARNNHTINLTVGGGGVITATYNDSGASSTSSRKFTYTKSGSTLTVTGHPGTEASIARTYTMSGSNLTAIAAAGDSVSIAYTTTTLIAQHNVAGAPPLRHSLTYASTANASAKQVTLEKGSTSASGVYVAGYERQVFVTDPAQQVIWASTSATASNAADWQGVHYRYNSENQMIGTTAPTVRQITSSAINFPSKTPTQTQPAPTSDFFTYDGRGNLINATNRAGGYTEYFYNTNDELNKVIDASRGVSWFFYDSLGRLTTTEKLISTSGQKSRTEYSYDSNSNLIQQRSAIKKVGSSFEWATVQYANHASNGAPKKVTYKDVKLSATANAQDLILTNDFDYFGNLTSQTTPLGTTSHATYDIAGKVKTVTDPQGVATTLLYDEDGCITETYKTASSITGKYEWEKITYNAVGLDVLTQLFAPDGSEISRMEKTFDVLGREVSATDSDIHGKETCSYDSEGNVTHSAPAAADIPFLETVTYDALNRPVFINNTQLSIQGDWRVYEDHSRIMHCVHGGIVYKVTRDASGNIIKVEQLGSYDLLSKPVVTTIKTYTVDNKPATETVQVVGEPKVEYVFDYDLMGRQTSVHLTGTGQLPSKTTYNTLGWILEEIDFDGVVSTYTYNKRGDVTSKKKGGLTTSAVYDSGGKITKSTQDDGTTVNFTYDAIGRLTGETHVKGATTVKAMSYSYDAKGRVATLADSVSDWSRALTYERVGVGEQAYLKVTATDTFGDGTVSTQIVDGDYFAQGSVTAEDGTVLTSSVTRDNIKRITSHSVGQTTHSRTYSTVEDMTKGLLVFDSALSASGMSYKYSQDGRIEATNYGRLSQSALYTYSVDRKDIKASKIGADIADTYSFDISKNLTEIYGGPSTAHLTYNAQGRITSKTAVAAQEISVPTTKIAVENNNANLILSSGWTLHTSTVHSGGNSHRASTTGAEIRFMARGSEIAFYGTTNANLGSFDVFVNGETTPAATFTNTKGTTVAYQQLLGKLTLPQGTHSILLKTKSSAIVCIDYVEISGATPACMKWENTSPLKIETSDARVTKNGEWTTSTNPVYSGGTTLRCAKPGGEMLFTIVGTEVAFYGSTTANQGSFDVFVNESPIAAATFTNTKGTSAAYQQLLGKVTLPQGIHTVRIKTKSTEPVCIDRIEISGGPANIITWHTNATARIEAESAAVVKKGTWTQVTGAIFSGGIAQRSSVAGSELTFTVTGREIVFIGAQNTNLGSFDVFLGSSTTPIATISSFSPHGLMYQGTLGRVSFPQGTHTIRIKTKTTELVEIDRIDVYGSTTQPIGTPVTTTYSYDQLGRRVSAQALGESTNYSWSGSRMIEVAGANLQTSYIYDGTGQRTQKTVTDATGKTKTSYVYSGLALLALDVSSQESTATASLSYLYGDSPTPVGGLYQSSDTTQTTAFEIVSDIRGDVREMRDRDGNAFARFDYDAYGNIRNQQIFDTELIDEVLAQSIVDTQPLRYAGYVWDSETSLYYCSQRYYDPTIAAFISKDPIKADGELSAYSYCAGDPIMNVDPSGLCYYSKISGNWVHDNWVGSGKCPVKQPPPPPPKTTNVTTTQQTLATVQAKLNQNLIGGRYYDANGGFRRCAGHVLNQNYECSGCYGVFDANGNFLGLSEKGKTQQHVLAYAVIPVSAVFPVYAQESHARMDNATSSTYIATPMEVQRKENYYASKQNQAEAGFGIVNELSWVFGAIGGGTNLIINGMRLLNQNIH